MNGTATELVLARAQFAFTVSFHCRVLTLSLFGLSLLGLGISMWPDLIPGRLAIWDGAAPVRSQSFVLVGAGILLPLILAYTAWAYWVFRGKGGRRGLPLIGGRDWLPSGPQRADPERGRRDVTLAGETC